MKLAMKISTFNMKHNLISLGSISWKKRIRSIAKLLDEVSPDILGTQELIYKTLSDLSASIPDYDWYGQGRGGNKKGEFTAIFYKRKLFVLERGYTFWLSKKPDKPASRSWFSGFPRICTVVHLIHRQTKKRFIVYNTHLDHISGLARSNGLKLIKQQIDESFSQYPNAAIIFMGDFNLRPNNKALRYLTPNDGGIVLSDSYNLLIKNQLPLESSYHGFLSANLSKGMPIDYIFTSKNCHIKSVFLNKSHIGNVYPSDHFPVVAEMEMTE